MSWRNEGSNWKMMNKGDWNGGINWGFWIKECKWKEK